MIEIDPLLVHNAKNALGEIKHELPVIDGRCGSFEYGKTTDLLQGNQSSEATISDLPPQFILDERLTAYFAAVINSAFNYQGEGPPASLRADIGVIGPAGQQLDYLHTDPHFHISWKLATGTANPSTLITDPRSTWEFMNIEGFLKTPTNEVPEEFFGMQVPEGCGSFIEPGVYHGEKALQMGKAVASIFAIYK